MEKFSSRLKQVLIFSIECSKWMKIVHVSDGSRAKPLSASKDVVGRTVFLFQLVYFITEVLFTKLITYFFLNITITQV